MDRTLPGTIEQEIAAHFQGRVRFATDRHKAEALPPTHGGTMDVVRPWVAADKEHIAWVVGAKVERIVILSRRTGRSWTWRITGDMDEEGARLYTFTWIDGHLIMVYAGDHYFHLVSIHGSDVTTQWILGDSVRVMQDRISVRAFASEAPVRLFGLPGLNEVERLSVAEAEARGVMPISLGLEYHQDHNQYPIGHTGQVAE